MIRNSGWRKTSEGTIEFASDEGNQVNVVNVSSQDVAAFGREVPFRPTTIPIK
jgi:hypothetical protein